MKIENLKRVISFTYQANKKSIYFRHYKIVTNESGISQSFKQIMSMNGKKRIDLSGFQSFAEVLGKQEEDFEQNGDNEDQRQKVRLVEMGPRMKLRFINYYEDVGHVAEEEGEGS